MHVQALDYVKRHTGGQWEHVVDVGGRDINGTARSVVDAKRATSIDLIDGNGVDVVADAREWRPKTRVDLVLCCEVLEHSDDPQGVIDALADYLAPGGLLVVTAASPGREPHSGIDGGTVRDGEHYANIDPIDLSRWMAQAGLIVENLETHDERGDCYACASLP